MIPPPPISTLFPYTTLFRSYGLRSVERQRSAAVARRVLVARPEPDRHEHQGRATSTRDRKSTRLNSSHTVISYAVFCLKKKKKKKKNNKNRETNYQTKRAMT